MSYRPCNFCDFQRSKKDAEGKGFHLEVRPAPLMRGDNPATQFPNGVEVCKIFDDGNEEVRTTWYAELPESCRC